VTVRAPPGPEVPKRRVPVPPALRQRLARCGLRRSGRSRGDRDRRHRCVRFRFLRHAFFPGLALAGEQRFGMRIVDAAQFLQAVPHLAAPACFPDQLLVDEHFLQHVVAIDHHHAGNLVRQALPFARQGLIDRDHAAVPLFPRNTRKVPGVALVARKKVDQREGEVVGNPLVVLVFVGKPRHRPVEVDLGIGRELKTRGQLGPADGS